MNRHRSILLLLVVFLTCLSLPACQRETAAPAANESPVVTVSQPLEREVVDYEVYPVPTIEGNNSIDIRARVSGYLSKIDFVSGTEVEKDKLLFVIDQRPYKADFDKATSSVKACEARLIRTKADLDRANQLIDSKAISKEDYDRSVASAAESEAALAGAKAQLEQAQNNMDYTEIRAPIGGRISRNLIDVGNLVQADTTLLTNIVNTDPIYVYFDMPESTVYRLLKERIENKTAGEINQKLADVVVELRVGNESGFPHRGHLNFIDNKVNPTTGTISLRAQFPNPTHGDGLRELLAGGHGNVRVPLSDPYKTLFVPEDAVSNDQSQKIVYVVNDKDEIVRKPVELGGIHDGLQAITKGLSHTDRVVINGAIRVRPGMKVKVEAGKIAEPAKAEK